MVFTCLFLDELGPLSLYTMSADWVGWYFITCEVIPLLGRAWLWWGWTCSQEMCETGPWARMWYHRCVWASTDRHVISLDVTAQSEPCVRSKSMIQGFGTLAGRFYDSCFFMGIWFFKNDVINRASTCSLLRPKWFEVGQTSVNHVWTRCSKSCKCGFGNVFTISATCICP